MAIQLDPNLRTLVLGAVSDQHLDATEADAIAAQLAQTAFPPGQVAGLASVLQAPNLELDLDAAARARTMLGVKTTTRGSNRPSASYGLGMLRDKNGAAEPKIFALHVDRASDGILRVRRGKTEGIVAPDGSFRLAPWEQQLARLQVEPSITPLSMSDELGEWYELSGKVQGDEHGGKIQVERFVTDRAGPMPTSPTAAIPAPYEVSEADQEWKTWLQNTNPRSLEAPVTFDISPSVGVSATPHLRGWRLWLPVGPVATNKSVAVDLTYSETETNIVGQKPVGTHRSYPTTMGMRVGFLGHNPGPLFIEAEIGGRLYAAPIAEDGTFRIASPDSDARSSLLMAGRVLGTGELELTELETRARSLPSRSGWSLRQTSSLAKAPARLPLTADAGKTREPKFPLYEQGSVNSELLSILDGKPRIARFPDQWGGAELQVRMFQSQIQVKLQRSSHTEPDWVSVPSSGAFVSRDQSLSGNPYRPTLGPTVSVEGQFGRDEKGWFVDLVKMSDPPMGASFEPRSEEWRANPLGSGLSKPVQRARPRLYLGAMWTPAGP